MSAISESYIQTAANNHPPQHHSTPVRQYSRGSTQQPSITAGSGTRSRVQNSRPAPQQIDRFADGAATFEDAHKLASIESIDFGPAQDGSLWRRCKGLSKPLGPTPVNVLFVPDDSSPALPVLVVGEPENIDEDRAKEILSEGKFEIKIQLGIWEENAQYWTCDFSYEYVNINGECRS